MRRDRLHDTPDDRWPWALTAGFVLGVLTVIGILWLQNNVLARWPL